MPHTCLAAAFAGGTLALLLFPIFVKAYDYVS
jgi:hypothetical protein